MAQLDNLLRMFKEFNRRILAMEAVYQAKVLQFGNIVLDAENDRITVGVNNEIVIDGANKRILWFDGTDNRIVIDGDGNLKISIAGENVLTEAEDDLAFVYNPATSQLKIRGEIINTSAEIFSHLSIEHYWTGSGAYIDRTGCRFAIDGDNFANQNVYFECVMANEQAARTAYARIYNITGGATLASSEITTTANPLTSLTRIRSGALTFPSGLKEYKLQIKQSPAGDGGDNAHFYAARLVITQQ